MTVTVERLKSQIEALSVPERAELAYFLLASLEPEQEEREEDWHLEIARRVEEIHNGQAKGRSVDEVLEELRELHPCCSKKGPK